MRYVSTRGEVPPMPFQEAVLTGQAPDGGLLLPARLPDLREALPELRRLTFPDVAYRVIAPFADDIPGADLRRLVDRAFAAFDHSEVVPLRTLTDFSVLELFHGPTLAFKDVALQLLGRLFGYVLERRGQVLNILGATSGDTGSAAIAGVRGQDNVAVFILYPKGRTSPLQELQMTTVADPNVHALALQGSFDDCQAIVKGTFNDLEFKARHHLGAVNSVNWARVLAQITYYVWAWLRATDSDDETVAFSVPTGNFGDIFAGYLAARMGVPVRRLVLATNENDILTVFFDTGRYARGDVVHTITPSMDIQVASNFERWLWYRLGGDPQCVRRFMSTFVRDGVAGLECEGPVDPLIRARRVDRAETLATMRRVGERDDYVLDPHTAVGVAAMAHADCGGLPPERRICLATAHPAKFPDAVREALGRTVTHPSLEALMGADGHSVTLPAQAEAVRAYVEAHALG